LGRGEGGLPGKEAGDLASKRRGGGVVQDKSPHAFHCHIWCHVVSTRQTAGRQKRETKTEEVGEEAKTF